MGPIYAAIRLQNAGPAPAVDVRLAIHFEPPLDTPRREWKHPVIAVGQFELFDLPEPPNTSQLTDLHTQAARHKALVVDLSWKNMLGKPNSLIRTFDLNDLRDGWYGGGHLVRPDDVPTLLEGIAKTLSKLEAHLEKIARASK